MIETLKRYWPAKVLVLLFLFFTVWWVYMTLFLDKSLSSDPFSLFGLFGITYGVIAAWGAIIGFKIAKTWGGWKSLMGRAIIMFSLGLLFQEFGQIAYSYYIYVLHVEVPYPSVGDIGFFGTIFFYIYGIYLLAQASGINFSVKSVSSKLQLVLIPLAFLLLSYFLILKNYSLDLSHPLTTFLNYGYPTGGAIYISIALLTYSLTMNILGGVMRKKILILILAFITQYIAEYAFIIFYDSYYPGGILDYIYAISYFVLGLAIFQLHGILAEVGNKK